MKIKVDYKIKKDSEGQKFYVGFIWVNHNESGSLKYKISTNVERFTPAHAIADAVRLKTALLAENGMFNV